MPGGERHGIPGLLASYSRRRRRQKCAGRKGEATILGVYRFYLQAALSSERRKTRVTSYIF